MSETPRTDFFVDFGKGDQPYQIVSAEHARQLERELAAAQKDCVPRSKYERAISSLRSYDAALADHIDAMKDRP